MNNAIKFLAGTIGAAAAITGLAMAKPEPAHAGEQAKQFEQSYCITSSAAERWKGCRWTAWPFTHLGGSGEPSTAVRVER